MLIAVVIPLALTLVVGKRRLSSKELGTEERSEAPDAEASPVDVPAEGIARALVSPLSGTVAPIDEMLDAVFSSKCMGDGLCIEPADGADAVVSPADATVTVTMPASNHAVGLTLDNGMELLIHIGIDTVDMGGDGFACHVSQGERVRAGQKLLSFSQDKIRAAGHPAITAFVVSATGSARDVTFERGPGAVAGSTEVVRYVG